MTREQITENLADVRRLIVMACEKFGRDPKTVQLLAVSKTKPVDMIRTAIEAGQHEFGESYLQEALDKITIIGTEQAHWHYIGAIQSNKTRAIAENFSWVHTIASPKVARRLSEQAPAALNTLVQVNISGESSKAGVAPAELPSLIESLMPFDNIILRGLMTLPAPAENFEKQRVPFRQLREHFEAIQREFGQDLQAFDQLSMGMTADLEAAIAEGTTWLRIGTAIFGERTT
ncbi:MAG: YggS family pyridoxal phosphate-dependent enzyme [Pseudomonadales bacterium]